MSDANNNIMEIWKKLSERYEVSNFGNVKSVEITRFDKKGRIRKKCGVKLSLKGERNGYPVVNVTGFGNKKNYKVHRLIAFVFLPNPNNLPCVNHIDGDRRNNNVKNLEWCTQKENIIHSFKVLKRKSVGSFGDKNGFSKKVKNTITGVEYGSLSLAVQAELPNKKYSTIRAQLSGQSTNKTNLIYI